MKQYWPIILTNIVLIPCLVYTLTHVFVIPEPVVVVPTPVISAEVVVIPEPQLPQKEYLGQYNLSRYYTVVTDQKKYYLNRTFEEDFNINCSGNCFITADGYHLTDPQWGKVVACPPDIKLGSRLLIEGIGEVTCHDRGGAIKGRRLDVWMGVGDAGVDRLYGKVTTYRGERQVYLLR